MPVRFATTDESTTTEAKIGPLDAVGEAAYNGRNGDLAALFDDNLTLVTGTDGMGRTALHWAVAGQQVMTVKYLLGRWCCADLMKLNDFQGHTPLCLYKGPPVMATLLMYGTLSPLGTSSPTLLRDANALLKKRVATNALSFLTPSVKREAPARVRPKCWVAAITAATCVVSIAPAALLLTLAMASPGAIVSVTFVLLIGLACVFRVLVRLWGVGGALQSAYGFVTREPRPAFVTLTLLLLMLGLQNFLCLASQWAAMPRLTAFHLLLQLITAVSYMIVVTNDPGFVPGAAPADRAAYWTALETVPGRNPHGGAERDAISEHPDFCPRSELRKVARARYSPYCRSMVRVMDHDCIFLGVCIGEGNHRSFIAFLFGACLSLLVGVTAARVLPPPAASPTDEWQRLYILGMLLGIITLLPLGNLLADQLRRIMSNVTAVEERRWQRSHPNELPPMRPDPELPRATWEARMARWREYAPYDKGSAMRNLAAFVRCERGAVADIELSPSGLAAGASHASTQTVEQRALAGKETKAMKNV